MAQCVLEDCSSWFFVLSTYHHLSIYIPISGHLRTMGALFTSTTALLDHITLNEKEGFIGCDVIKNCAT